MLPVIAAAAILAAPAAPPAPPGPKRPPILAVLSGRVEPVATRKPHSYPVH